MKITFIIGIAVIIILILNIMVTVKINKSEYISKHQKGIQILLVWLIPIAGALLIYFFHKNDETPKGPRKPPFGGGYGESGSVI
jgi:amino acid transporter